MNSFWEKLAIEKLRIYTAKKQSLQSIPNEIAQLEEAAYSIRSASADGTPVSGGGSGREDRLLNNICMRSELQKSYEQAKAWISGMDAALSALSQEERLILDRFYIYPEKNNVDRLCGDLHIEKTQVYIRRDAAIRRFAICLYGRTEI